METKFKEEEINEGWRYVHSSLGFRIWDDIQGMKQRLINGDKILKKMEMGGLRPYIIFQVFLQSIIMFGLLKTMYFLTMNLHFLI